jgi:hypothetical protein
MQTPPEIFNGTNGSDQDECSILGLYFQAKGEYNYLMDMNQAKELEVL